MERAQYAVEVATAAKLMEVPPYLVPDEKAPTRLDRAVKWVLEGRVEQLDKDFYQVAGSSGTVYTLKDTLCECDHASKGKSRWCYHAVSVQLYKNVQQRITPFPREEPATMATAPTLETPTATPFPEDGSPIADAPAPTNSHTRKAPVLILPRRSIQAIVADLSRPLPKECVATKTLKGQSIPYLHWQTVARVLDTYAPGWHGIIARVDPVGANVAITYRLTIPCVEGDITREATGQEGEEVDGYGDSTSNAEAMAFKRAAAKFGVGQWLYTKDGTDAALAEHFKAEKTVCLGDLGIAIDTLHLSRDTIIAWLRKTTGATRNADIPLGALKALSIHLASLTE